MQEINKTSSKRGIQKVVTSMDIWTTYVTSTGNIDENANECIKRQTAYNKLTYMQQNGSSIWRQSLNVNSRHMIFVNKLISKNVRNTSSGPVVKRN